MISTQSGEFCVSEATFVALQAKKLDSMVRTLVTQNCCEESVHLLQPLPQMEVTWPQTWSWSPGTVLWLRLHTAPGVYYGGQIHPQKIQL